MRCAGLVGGEAFRALASLLLRLRVLLDLGELELGALDAGHIPKGDLGLRLHLHAGLVAGDGRELDALSPRRRGRLLGRQILVAKQAATSDERDYAKHERYQPHTRS